MITLEQYFGPWLDHRLVTDEMHAAARDLLTRVNALLAEAERDGVSLDINPRTRTLISGAGNGGWRLPTSEVGAPRSSHKEGRAVDIYDPNDGDLDAWCLDHLGRLIALGLYLEHPAATKGWCHLTTRAPRSGNRVFYP